MCIGDERNRPRVVADVQDIIPVHANHNRYGANSNIRWERDTKSAHSFVSFPTGLSAFSSFPVISLLPPGMTGSSNCFQGVKYQSAIIV